MKLKHRKERDKRLISKLVSLLREGIRCPDGKIERFCQARNGALIHRQKYTCEVSLLYLAGLAILDLDVSGQPTNSAQAVDLVSLAERLYTPSVFNKLEYLNCSSSFLTFSDIANILEKEYLN